MRILKTLAMLLVLCLPTLGATTWPASTNANQTFFGTNTFTKTIQGTATNAINATNAQFLGSWQFTGDGGDFFSLQILGNTNSSFTYNGLTDEITIGANISDVYAKAFHGPLVGTSSLSGGSTNDDLGNKISTTYLPLTGGTVSGPILSTSSTTNAPSATELSTAGWVRGLFNNGILDYATTNIVSGATNNDTAGQPVYSFSTSIPPSASRSYVNPAVGTYVGAVMTTNTFTFLQGPIEVNAYMTITTGGGDAIAVHPELYYSYDKTNWLGDYSAQQQSIVGGTTNLYQFVISFPAITATNSSGFYIERRLKIHSKGGTPTLTFLIGTNIASGVANASHISFSGPNSGSGNAYLANNQTFTGSNNFAGGFSVTGGGGSNWIGGNLTVQSNIFGTLASGKAFSFGTINTVDSTNFVVDFNGVIYQKIVATNSVNFVHCTNGPGAASVKIRPNGADRTISFPTNWVWLGTNSLALSGSIYTATVTNGPRVGWLSVVADGADPTNVVAQFKLTQP